MKQSLEVIVLDLERTLVLIKPDGVVRGIAFQILSRFEQVGLKTVALKLTVPDEELVKNHYLYEDIATRHSERIWKQLIRYLTGEPVIATVLEGYDAVQVTRKLCGTTEPLEASPGTIRGDFCHQSFEVGDHTDKAVRNVVHASATPEEAESEIEVWFEEEEIFDYDRADGEQHR